MKRFLLCVITLLSISCTMLSTESKPPKIVGLVGVRNESYIIRQCLKALALYTDAIVFLDDASDDDTLAIARSLQAECHIEIFINKTEWKRDENGDKNKLLQAGRDIGGTHFVLLDADEMFSANCQDNNALRTIILSLQPGDKLVLPLIDLWNSVYTYRIDKSPYAHRILDCAFCDDGICYYDLGFLHVSHSPQHLTGKERWVMDNKVALHFAFVNRQEVLIKHAWYKCLERIRLPDKPAAEINAAYDRGISENAIILARIPDTWFAYDFFDPAIGDHIFSWRAQHINRWFDEYGKDYFADLTIWDIDWDTYKN